MGTTPDPLDAAPNNDLTEGDIRYARAPIRYMALAVDLVILAAFFFPVTRLVKGTWVMSASDHRWAVGWFVTDPLCLVFLVVMFAYFTLGEAYFGCTFGKRLVGLSVVGPDGGAPGVGRALTRNLLRLVDGLPALGILAAVLITTSVDRTRLGDRLGDTRVIHARGTR